MTVLVLFGQVKHKRKVLVLFGQVKHKPAPTLLPTPTPTLNPTPTLTLARMHAPVADPP